VTQADPLHLFAGASMSLSHCPNCGCQLRAFEPIRFGNVLVESRSEIVFNGRVLALARTQHGIVDALVRARGRYLSREALVGALGSDVYDQAICQYVKRGARRLPRNRSRLRPDRESARVRRLPLALPRGRWRCCAAVLGSRQDILAGRDARIVPVHRPRHPAVAKH
jgi:hypothetical protein